MPLGVPQECEFCNSVFIPKREKSKYCSRSCKDTHRNRTRERKTTKSYLKANALKSNPLKDEELQILYGSMLGDGSLIKSAHGYRFSLCHSEPQLEYLIWKKSVLANLFLANPSRYESTFRDTVTIQYHLHSIHHPQLEEIYNLFFIDGKRKPISEELLDYLNPLGLAVWYMDDGSYNRNPNSMQATLSTDALTKSENQIIADWFKDRHEIEVKVQKVKASTNFGKKDTYRLRINRSQTDKFFSLIRTHIHSTMLYKLK